MNQKARSLRDILGGAERLVALQKTAIREGECAANLLEAYCQGQDAEGEQVLAAVERLLTCVNMIRDAILDEERVRKYLRS